MTTEEADEFGGCGSSGFYQQDGTEVYFQSTICHFTTSESTASAPTSSIQSTESVSTSSVQTTDDHHADSQSESTSNDHHKSSDRLSDGAVAGIVSGSAIGLILITIAITYYIGKRPGTTGNKYYRL